MKTLLLALTLLTTASAWAQWVRVDGFVDEHSFYYDPSTIRKDGNFRKVWELRDLKSPNQDGELSEKTRKEYDCQQERFQTLFLSTHINQMGRGMSNSMLSSAPSAVWSYIQPGSASELMLKIVCAK